MVNFPRLMLSAAIIVVTGIPAPAALVINVNYSGDVQYQSAFASAKTTWESLLVGYQDGVVFDRTPKSSAMMGETLSQVNIAATIESIDGVGKTLGEAGYDQIVLDTSGYRLVTDGAMRFDSADIGLLTASALNNLILHEMAHVLGFGTIWTGNGVYAFGSGKFIGEQATAAWQSEFGQSGNPAVELGGQSGTANGHWNEVDGGGGLTGITDAFGRDMRDELMTGWLNPNSFISNMTIASFADIGFITNPSANAIATPEPSSVALIASLGAVIAWKRRRMCSENEIT